MREDSPAQRRRVRRCRPRSSQPTTLSRAPERSVAELQLPNIRSNLARLARSVSLSAERSRAGAAWPRCGRGRRGEDDGVVVGVVGAVVGEAFIGRRRDPVLTTVGDEGAVGRLALAAAFHAPKPLGSVRGHSGLDVDAFRRRRGLASPPAPARSRPAPRLHATARYVAASAPSFPTSDGAPDQLQIASATASPGSSSVNRLTMLPGRSSKVSDRNTYD